MAQRPTCVDNFRQNSLACNLGESLFGDGLLLRDGLLEIVAVPVELVMRSLGFLVEKAGRAIRAVQGVGDAQVVQRYEIVLGGGSWENPRKNFEKFDYQNNRKIQLSK